MKTRRLRSGLRKSWTLFDPCHQMPHRELRPGPHRLRCNPTGMTCQGRCGGRETRLEVPRPRFQQRRVWRHHSLSFHRHHRRRHCFQAYSGRRLGGTWVMSSWWPFLCMRSCSCVRCSRDKRREQTLEAFAFLSCMFCTSANMLLKENKSTCCRVSTPPTHSPPRIKKEQPRTDTCWFFFHCVCVSVCLWLRDMKSTFSLVFFHMP